MYIYVDITNKVTVLLRPFLDRYGYYWLFAELLA